MNRTCTSTCFEILAVRLVVARTIISVMMVLTTACVGETMAGPDASSSEDASKEDVQWGPDAEPMFDADGSVAADAAGHASTTAADAASDKDVQTSQAMQGGDGSAGPGAGDAGIAVELGALATYRGKLPVFACGRYGTGGIASARFTPDGREFLAATASGVIKRYSYPEFEDRGTLELPVEYASLNPTQVFNEPTMGEPVVSDDGRVVLIELNGELQAWSLADGRSISTSELTLNDFETLTGSLVERLAPPALAQAVRLQSKPLPGEHCLAGFCSPGAYSLGLGWSKKTGLVTVVRAAGRMPVSSRSTYPANVEFWSLDGTLIRRSVMSSTFVFAVHVAVHPSGQSVGIWVHDQAGPHPGEIHYLDASRPLQPLVPLSPIPNTRPPPSIPPDDPSALFEFPGELRMWTWRGNDLIAEFGAWAHVFSAPTFVSTVVELWPTLPAYLGQDANPDTSWVSSFRALHPSGTEVLTLAGGRRLSDYSLVRPWSPGSPEKIRAVAFTPNEESVLLRKQVGSVARAELVHLRMNGSVPFEPTSRSEQLGEHAAFTRDGSRVLMSTGVYDTTDGKLLTPWALGASPRDLFAFTTDENLILAPYRQGWRTGARGALYDSSDLSLLRVLESSGEWSSLVQSLDRSTIVTSSEIFEGMPLQIRPQNVTWRANAITRDAARFAQGGALALTVAELSSARRVYTLPAPSERARAHVIDSTLLVTSSQIFDLKRGILYAGYRQFSLTNQPASAGQDEGRWRAVEETEIFSLQDGKSVLRAEPATYFTAISRDGKRVIRRGMGPAIAVQEVDTGRIIATFESTGTHDALNHDGTIVATSDNDYVRLYDIAPGIVRERTVAWSGASQLVFSPRGTFVAAPVATGARVLRTETTELVADIPCPYPCLPTFSSDETHAAAGDTLVRLSDLAVVSTYVGFGDRSFIAADPDARTVYRFGVSATGVAAVLEFSMTDGKLLREIEYESGSGPGLGTAAFSDSGEELLWMGATLFRRIRAADRVVLSSLPATTTGFLSPSGRRFVQNASDYVRFYCDQPR